MQSKTNSRKIILRIISCTLSLLLILSVTACNAKYPRLNKDTPVAVTIWHHYLGEQKVAFDSLVTGFNETIGAQKGITVKAYSMDNTGDIHNKLISAATGEPGAADMPDMATAYPGTAYTLYHLNKLTSLEKYLSKEELSKYVDSFLEEGRLTSESGLIIFPIAKSTEALYINYTFYRDFLRDYNAKNPSQVLNEEMLSTLEGIQKTAKAYYEWTDNDTPQKANDGKALFGFDAASNFAVIGFRQLGADFFSVNGKTGTIDLNNPAMKKIWDEYYAPMAKGYYGAYSFYRSQDVQTGDLLMFVGSTAGAKFFPKTVTFADNTKHEIELKILPFPVLEGGKKAAVQQGAGVIISKSDPQKEYASTIFLKWLTEPERNVSFVLKTGYLPVTKEAINTTLSAELTRIIGNPDYANVAMVIGKTLDMMKTHELYTYKPFEHSDVIRYAFEDKLLEEAQTARKNFVKALSAGKSFDQCVSEIITKDGYERFLTEVRNEILKAQ